MLMKKPLVIAISAAGLCVAAENALAFDPFQSLCGTTISGSQFNDCGSIPETLAADCTIVVGTGANLGISGCNVDAGGHKVTIKGNLDTAPNALFLGSNTITNASKIDINFKGSSLGDCAPTVIFVNYDMSSNGNINMNVACGGISVYLPYGAGLDAAGNLLSLKTGDGNITVKGVGENSLLSSGLQGAVKIEAGGGGVATVGDTVSLSAKQIKIVSNGGISVVENAP